MTSSAILIPARYGSTRFPGKPLIELDGVPMSNDEATRDRTERAAEPADNGSGKDRQKKLHIDKGPEALVEAVEGSGKGRQWIVFW